VPRWPSLFFSGVFVIAAFFLGRQVYDTGAAWAMALLATLASTLVELGRHARYYSATLAFHALCGLAVWNACRRGRILDYALAGLAIGLLFHTHALSAVTMVGLFAAMLPWVRGQPRLLLKLTVAGLVAGTLVLPWAAWSGFMGQATQIPYALQTMSVSVLLQTLPSTDPTTLLIGGLGIVWFLGVRRLGDHLPARWRRPVEDHADAFYFASIWTVLAYVSFVCLIPSVSYWLPRVKLAVAVPGCLLVTVVLTALTRTLRPGLSWLPSASILAYLAVTDQLLPEAPSSGSPVKELAPLVRSWRLGAEGRIFASPNYHLALTYYAGQPVQSAAAVRRSWFDSFSGDLVIIEHRAYSIPGADEVQEIAARVGVRLTGAEAEARAEELYWLVPGVELVGQVAEVHPPPRSLSDLDRALLEATRETTRRRISELASETPLAHMTRPENWRDFWLFFFYSFSDPETRVGPKANYYERTRRARAYVLRDGWVIYDCRPLNSPPLAGLGPAPKSADAGQLQSTRENIPAETHSRNQRKSWFSPGGRPPRRVAAFKAAPSVFPPERSLSRANPARDRSWR
jgi:Dolichyl-phosphate-mannose-protein mannosyltransferase